MLVCLDCLNLSSSLELLGLHFKPNSSKFGKFLILLKKLAQVINKISKNQ